MTYQEQAQHLLRGVVFDPAGTEYSQVFAEIAEALQEAFDLGYCAAGGSIHELTQFADKEITK